MDLVEMVERTIGARKDKLILILQGLTAAGVLLSITLMVHVGPVTLFTFMTVAQGLIIVSFIISSIILITQLQNILR